jgi:hypothetical protein
VFDSDTTNFPSDLHKTARLLSATATVRAASPQQHRHYFQAAPVEPPLSAALKTRPATTAVLDPSGDSQNSSVVNLDSRMVQTRGQFGRSINMISELSRNRSNTICFPSGVISKVLMAA